MKLLLEDFRLAVRLVCKSPRFLAVCLFSLVLGIGINCLIFNLVDATILRPFAFKNSHRLVRIFGSANSAGKARISYEDFQFLREHARTIDHLAASEGAPMFIRNEDGAEMLLGRGVSSAYFDLLELKPQLGRFRAGSDEWESPIVISHSLWQRRFGQDPSIIGRRIQLMDRTATVLGVTPKGFYGTDRIFTADVWWPLETWYDWKNARNRQQPRVVLLAELREGVSVEQCRAELNVLVPRLPGATRESERCRGFGVTPEHEYTGIGEDGKEGKKVVAILLLLPGIVLLIACINVSALFSSRFEERRREFAIRMALGGTRFRLARQLLIEGLVLSLVSATICLLVGVWAVDGLALLLPKLSFSLDLGLRTDYRVVVFTVLLSLVATLAFGLGPTLRFSKSDLSSVMRNVRRTQPVSGRMFGRSLVLTGQIAVSLALLAITAVLVASSFRGLNVDLGFGRKDLLLTALTLPKNQKDLASFSDPLLEAVRTVPGVAAAEVASCAPFDSWHAPGSQTVFMPDDSAGDQGVAVRHSYVGESYFELLQIGVRRGRIFTAGDYHSGTRVAVISEAMARRFWPRTDPIGQRLHAGSRSAPPTEVIGVVNDVASGRLARTPEAFFYLPLAQSPPRGSLTLMLGAHDADGVSPRVRAAVRRLYPEVVFVQTTSLENNIRVTLLPNQIAATLLGAFGVLALLLSSIGLYGVVSYIVKQRTQEIGIRLAMGAPPSRILGLTMRRGFVLSTFGSVLGLAMAFPFVTRIRAEMLDARDGWVVFPCSLATGVLLLVVLLATYLPAYKASRMDPMNALRHE